MAGSDLPESLLSFVEKHKSRLPAVVEIAEGIYGELEKDSDVRDFSRGDILRLVSVKEEVNITFDSVYAGPSKKGFITVDRHFNECQFEVISSFKDGYVYKTLDQITLDSPEYIRAVKSDKDADIEVGDRLKLLARSRQTGKLVIQCKNIRTGQNVDLHGDVKQSYAKKIGNNVVNMDSIYPRLPQRVRLVLDEGQRIRGKFHGIPGLDANFNGEMNLSQIEVVKASPWEDPERIIQIPVNTDVFVYPRKDWGDKIGPVVDIHELAKAATPESRKVAVVVDDESVVAGCPKDTIIFVCGSQTSKYAIAKGKGGTVVLIPENYPSLFRVIGNTWSTVEDLLRERMCDDVNVGTTYKSPEKELDTLYQHDVVRVTSLEPALIYCTRDECEVVEMDRSRSLVGKVGSITVPTFAKANFYETAQPIGDCVLSKILAQSLPLRVTLSQPNVTPSSPDDVPDVGDDLLFTMSPLEITGTCKIDVAVCQPLDTDRQTSCHDVICIPAVSKLNVRSVTRPTIDVGGQDKLPSLNTSILRISERQLESFREETYDQIPPPVPRRGEDAPVVPSKKPPARPPKSLRLSQYVTQQDNNNDEDVPFLPPRKDERPPSSPSSPTRKAKLLSLLAGSLRNPKKKPRSPIARHPELRALPPSPTENPYKLVGKEGCKDDIAVDYEVTFPNQSPRYETDSDGDRDYENPEDDYEKPPNESPDVPPKDGNISAYGQSELIRLLGYLRVDRRMVDTFTSKRIDGKTLCDLCRSHNDESLRNMLGADDIKDWLALKYFITMSTSDGSVSI